MPRKEKGAVLVVVVIIAFIFVLMGFAVLTLAEQEAILTRIETDKARAFYLAEAGLAKLQEKLYTQKISLDDLLKENIEEDLAQGSYRLDFTVADANDANYYAVSTGIAGTVQKKIRVRANFLAPPFEDAVYALNKSGTPWALQLRGKGDPNTYSGGERGGKDKIYGSISIDGDVFLYEQSFINAAPAPNKWNINGDVTATGSINVLDSAGISGAKNPAAPKPAGIDLVSMDYANNNTHNVAQIFQEAGVTKGYLPNGNELRDVFVINPASMNSECDSTAGNDYFFEPVAVSGGGSEKGATTPLHMGNDRVYYVDGDVWVHNKTTYGFLVDGKVTIVATGDIHISDNLIYADADSILGLVALGQYDSAGNLTSGGNIFFGDPRYGTMFTASAMMFAANDFLFNTDAISRVSAESTTGFTVNGCFSAMNQVLINRDWYPTGSGKTATVRPAKFISASGKWVDAETGTELAEADVLNLRHYQMIVNYDDRVRCRDTQPPGLPRGLGRIFAGFSNWEEF